MEVEGDLCKIVEPFLTEDLYRFNNIEETAGRFFHESFVNLSNLDSPNGQIIQNTCPRRAIEIETSDDSSIDIRKRLDDSKLLKTETREGCVNFISYEQVNDSVESIHQPFMGLLKTAEELVLKMRLTDSQREDCEESKVKLKIQSEDKNESTRGSTNSMSISRGGSVFAEFEKTKTMNEEDQSERSEQRLFDRNEKRTCSRRRRRRRDSIYSEEEERMAKDISREASRERDEFRFNNIVKKLETLKKKAWNYRPEQSIIKNMTRGAWKFMKNKAGLKIVSICEQCQIQETELENYFEEKFNGGSQAKIGKQTRLFAVIGKDNGGIQLDKETPERLKWAAWLIFDFILSSRMIQLWAEGHFRHSSFRSGDFTDFEKENYDRLISECDDDIKNIKIELTCQRLEKTRVLMLGVPKV